MKSFQGRLTPAFFLYSIRTAQYIPCRGIEGWNWWITRWRTNNRFNKRRKRCITCWCGSANPHRQVTRQWIVVKHRRCDLFVAPEVRSVCRKRRWMIRERRRCDLFVEAWPWMIREHGRCDLLFVSGVSPGASPTGLLSCFIAVGFSRRIEIANRIRI